jgi:2-polyprenyl-3-methyl-5-hydroxy-6-metoxy-1,4-benzoquinol methylase
MKIVRSHCPVCLSKQFTKTNEVIDYSVSQETFELYECEQCSFVFTQSVPDQTTIGPYYHFKEYISHTNTSESFFHKVYHKVRNYTLQQKLRWVKKYTHQKQGKLLDIGCGTGAFLAHAKKNNWQIEGIEADEAARKNALEIHQVDAKPSEALFTLTERYDAITMWHVLQHVHDLERYLVQIKNLLTVEGRLFIAVPNHTSFDAKHYQHYWAAYDVPRHLYHFHPQSMQVLAERCGFAIEAYKPMWFDSVYVSILSEKYKKGSSIKGLFIGCNSNLLALLNTKKCSSVTYVLKSNQ